jgi:hypothetical protein
LFVFVVNLICAEGPPQPATEQGYYEAAIGAFDWAEKTFPELPIVVYGQSLGTGAAW